MLLDKIVEQNNSLAFDTSTPRQANHYTVSDCTFRKPTTTHVNQRAMYDVIRFCHIIGRSNSAFRIVLIKPTTADQYKVDENVHV